MSSVELCVTGGDWWCSEHCSVTAQDCLWSASTHTHTVHVSVIGLNGHYFGSS